MLKTVLSELNRPLEEAMDIVNQLASKAAALRAEIKSMGFLAFEGWDVYSKIQAYALETEEKTRKIKSKLQMVDNIVTSGLFPADQLVNLVVRKAEIEAAIGALLQDFDDLQHIAGRNNLWAAVQGIWEQASTFVKSISTELLRLTVTMTKQIGAQIDRWLLE